MAEWGHCGWAAGDPSGSVGTGPDPGSASSTSSSDATPSSSRKTWRTVRVVKVRGPRLCKGETQGQRLNEDSRRDQGDTEKEGVKWGGQREIRMGLHAGRVCMYRVAIPKPVPQYVQLAIHGLRGLCDILQLMLQPPADCLGPGCLLLGLLQLPFQLFHSKVPLLQLGGSKGRGHITRCDPYRSLGPHNEPHPSLLKALLWLTSISDPGRRSQSLQALKGLLPINTLIRPYSTEPPQILPFLSPGKGHT